MNMRRHDSRREKRNQIIISMFIAAIMIFSILGFIYGRDPTTNKIKYEINNRTYFFEKEYNTYSLTIDTNKVVFYTLPSDVDFNLTKLTMDRVKNSKMIYMTFDPGQEDLSYVDLVRFSLAEELLGFGIFIVGGVTEETDQYQLPVVDCNNATAFVPVIKFQNSNTTEINLKENCIIIKGKNFDFVKFRDLLLYKLYGVL